MLHETISSNCVPILVKVSISIAVDNMTAPCFNLQDYSHLHGAVILLTICSSERIE